MTWTIFLAALFASVATASIGADASRGAVDVEVGTKPRISLVVPRRIPPHDPATARGKISSAVGDLGVLIEIRDRHRWRRRAFVRPRGSRFRVAFVLPARIDQTRVRAVLVKGGRRLATSRARLVQVRRKRIPAVRSGAPGPVYWGAWIGNQLTGTAAPFDMAAVTKFEQMTGKPMSMLEFASPFANCATSPCSYYQFPTPYFEAIRQHGAVPFLSWSSESMPSSATKPDFQLSDLIAGTYDGYVRSFANKAKAWGHPFFLRFDWEMNGNWFPWGEGVNGNHPGEYVTAWRHVHAIFTSVGATNATWVWCPYGNWDTDLTPFYPGDRYVDWTCLDGYNWGTNPALRRTWKPFTELFGSAYHQIVNSLAPSKPMVIGETATTEWGGSKAEWIQNMFESLPIEFPKVRGLLWFEQSANGMDWPLESSESALGAFRAGIDDGRYVGNSVGGISTSPIPAP